MWFAYGIYGVIWLSTSLAVIAGMYFTHNPWCLLALIIPACLRVSTSNDEDDSEKE